MATGGPLAAAAHRGPQVRGVDGVVTSGDFARAAKNTDEKYPLCSESY